MEVGRGQNWECSAKEKQLLYIFIASHIVKNWRLKTVGEVLIFATTVINFMKTLLSVHMCLKLYTR
jgi:hypothetical protein